jgi:hypothetical protein
VSDDRRTVLVAFYTSIVKRCDRIKILASHVLSGATIMKTLTHYYSKALNLSHENVEAVTNE